jgi:hypothetical protein
MTEINGSERVPPAKSGLVEMIANITKTPPEILGIGAVLFVLMVGWIFLGLQRCERREKVDVPMKIVKAANQLDTPKYILSAYEVGAALVVSRDGEVAVPMDNGGKGMLFRFHKGKLHGEQKVFADSQTPLRIFTCENGKMQGMDTFYDRKGKIIRKLVWDKGKCLGAGK